MEIRRVDGEEGIADAISVRHEVFIEEQGVSEERELDGRDGDSTHFVVYDRGESIGAARLRPYEGDSGDGDSDAAKVERVAVRIERRGEGVGRALIAAVEAAAETAGYEDLVLYAQVPVVPFYRGLDFQLGGEAFEDAGIAHREMRKRL